MLFPVYDPDTSILYVWGKGERVIQAYEVHPENDREPIAKLPGFTGDSPQIATMFLPKRMVDMKKVEVAKALRLTAKTLEEVGFTIPRNKASFLAQTSVSICLFVNASSRISFKMTFTCPPRTLKRLL